MTLARRARSWSGALLRDAATWAASGVALWVVLVSRLQRSYLDFIVSGYAIAAGAMVGAVLCDRMTRETLWKSPHGR